MHVVVRVENFVIGNPIWIKQGVTGIAGIGAGYGQMQWQTTNIPPNTSCRMIAESKTIMNIW
jgi:hypothetical protein